MFLDDDTFSEVVAATPLVSIDLVITDAFDRSLLGRRLNRPAQGFWFVPGGRIRKNETLESAFTRISKAELGYSFPFADAQFMGVYEHLYEDSMYADNISTHYVVLAYRICLSSALTLRMDEQHSCLEWWAKEAISAHDSVHANTKAYFK